MSVGSGARRYAEVREGKMRIANWAGEIRIRKSVSESLRRSTEQMRIGDRGMMFLRAAQPGEEEVLTALCLRSKAIWGYDKTFLEACRAELTITAETLQVSLVQVAVAVGRIVGVAELFLSGGSARLEKLFVEPSCLRSGVGRALFDWCASAARAEGADELVIDSDPGAAEFYRRLGAFAQGSVASGSIPGRRIPRLVFGLRDEQSGTGVSPVSF